MTSICVLVLCGIPGAGKSTWTKKLISYTRETENLASFVQRQLVILNKHGLGDNADIEGTGERIRQREGQTTYRVIHIAYDELIPEDLEVELIHDAQNHSKETKSVSWKTYRRAIVRCVDDLIAKLSSLSRLPQHLTCASLTQIVTKEKTGDVAEKRDMAGSRRLSSSCQESQRECQVMDDTLVAEVTNDVLQSQSTDDKSTSQNATSLSQIYSSSNPYAVVANDPERKAANQNNHVIERERLKFGCNREISSVVDSDETVPDFLKTIFDDVVRRQMQGELSSGVRWILVIDDNMYYSSMRYEFYQLARKYTTGFAQIYFPVELMTAIQRNRTRKRQVEESVIRDMLNRLERPCVEISWEKYTATWINEKWDQSCFENVLRLIYEAMSNPVMPIAEDKAGAEESRTICSASLLHQADVALRKILGTHIASAKGIGQSKAELSHLAESSNLIRQKILDDLRNQTLSVPGEMLLETSADLENPFRSYLKHLFHQRLKMFYSKFENNFINN